MHVCLDKASPNRSPAESCPALLSLVCDECGNSGGVSIDVQRECANCFPQGAIVNHAVFLLSYRDSGEETRMR